MLIIPTNLKNFRESERNPSKQPFFNKTEKPFNQQGCKILMTENYKGRWVNNGIYKWLHELPILKKSKKSQRSKLCNTVPDVICPAYKSRK